MEDFVPGLVVAGRYRLSRIVGSGGMGEVWAAEDGSTGKRVALKRLLPDAAKHHEVVARFKREAFLLGRLRSEFVARVVDFVEDETFGLVLVMEFIDGPSLAQILEVRTLTVEEAVDLGVDLLHALCDLHDAKIVHRDLKPGNIIMRPMPGRPRATIVDFGISRLLANASEEEVTGITRANIALGTVEYMAPEQILSSRDVTPITDLYAIGIILFRSVKGHHAFGDRRGEELARAKLIEEPPLLDTGRQDEVATGLAAVIARALKKKPAHRYQSAKAMLAEVEELARRAASAAEDDLDDTTSDSGTTAVKRSPLASMPGSAVPPAGNGPVHRPPMGSIPDFGPMPSPPPSGPGASMPMAPRASMPSVPDSHGRSAVDPRASFVSIPDRAPPLMADPATESLDRPGVPRATVALAVLTAFAVGAAVGLVLAPSSAPAGKVAEASACPPAEAVTRADASQAAAPPVAATAEALASAAPPASASAAPARSSAPIGPVASAPKAPLTGKIPKPPPPATAEAPDPPPSATSTPKNGGPAPSSGEPVDSFVP